MVLLTVPRVSVFLSKNGISTTTPALLQKNSEDERFSIDFVDPAGTAAGFLIGLSVASAVIAIVNFVKHLTGQKKLLKFTFSAT